MLRVLAEVLPGVTTEGENEQVAPAGRLEHASDTAAVNEPPGSRATV